MREIGNERQVIDEERQVANAEIRAAQRLRRQDQDEAARPLPFGSHRQGSRRDAHIIGNTIRVYRCTGDRHGTYQV